MAQFLWQALDQGATLVTANARLARNYRIEFDSRQQASGKGVWPTAEIFSWPVWIDRLHQAGFPPEVVMNEHQQAALWQQAIAEDSVSCWILRLRQRRRRGLGGWWRHGTFR